MGRHYYKLENLPAGGPDEGRRACLLPSLSRPAAAAIRSGCQKSVGVLHANYQTDFSSISNCGPQPEEGAAAADGVFEIDRGKRETSGEASFKNQLRFTGDFNLEIQSYPLHHGAKIAQELPLNCMIVMERRGFGIVFDFARDALSVLITKRCKQECTTAALRCNPRARAEKMQNSDASDDCGRR